VFVLGRLDLDDRQDVLLKVLALHVFGAQRSHHLLGRVVCQVPGVFFRPELVLIDKFLQAFLRDLEVLGGLLPLFKLDQAALVLLYCLQAFSLPLHSCYPVLSSASQFLCWLLLCFYSLFSAASTKGSFSLFFF